MMRIARARNLCATRATAGDEPSPPRFAAMASCSQALLLLVLSSLEAQADGGVMRLRQAQGPFVITIFTTPELTSHRPVDVSVLVQRRDSNEVILDAAVDLLLTPPPLTAVTPADPICGPSGVGLFGQNSPEHDPRFSVPATRARSSNKLLYAAEVEFGTPGDWTLDARVKSKSESARFTCRIPVGPTPRQLAGLLPYLVLPPIAVVLFALNQWLRKSQRTDEASTPRRTNDTIRQIRSTKALPASNYAS